MRPGKAQLIGIYVESESYDCHAQVTLLLLLYSLTYLPTYLHNKIAAGNQVHCLKPNKLLFRRGNKHQHSIIVKRHASLQLNDLHCYECYQIGNSWQQILLLKQPKCLVTFWADVKTIAFKFKLIRLLFGQILENLSYFLFLHLLTLIATYLSMRLSTIIVKLINLLIAKPWSSLVEGNKDSILPQVPIVKHLFIIIHHELSLGIVLAFYKYNILLIGLI